MTSGCAPGSDGADTPAWTSPLIVQESTLRCPEVDAAAAREFRRVTPPPKPDVTDSSGAPALSVGAWKKATDDLRVSEARKNRAGRRLIDDYERCRAGIFPAAS